MAKATTTTSDNTPTVIAPVNRSTVGLRDMLFDEIDRFREGKIDNSQVVAVTRLSDAVVKTVRLELDVFKMKVRMGRNNEGATPGSLILTGPSTVEE